MLREAVDIHTHPNPDVGELKRLDFIGAVKQASEVEINAVVFKPLSYFTMDKSYTAEKTVPKIKDLGTILLDRVTRAVRSLGSSGKLKSFIFQSYSLPTV